jgi:hypothetical protein
VATFHVYIKPYADDQGSAYGSWTEVSDDVVSINTLSQQLDNTDYDIGVFRSSNCKVKFRNDHGLYGPIGTLETMFKYRRGTSKVKVTWEPGDTPLICGFFLAGAPTAILSEEVDVFEGILDDTTSKSPIDEQTIEFLIQGYESVLADMAAPTSIANGDTLASAIYAILNQAPFNQYVTVSLANIVTGAVVTIDDVTKLANKTCLEALKLILFPSSSVLYVKNNIAYVAPRTPGADLAYSFYGWASVNGLENIINIDNFTTGENRIYNYLTWNNTSLLSQDATSVQLNGVQKKEVTLDIITDNTKRTTLLNAIRDEFKDKKREMHLTAKLEDSTLVLGLLDRVLVDYPAEYVVKDNEAVAIYGIGTYGVNYYAEPITRLQIETTARFKILARKVDFVNQTIQFQLREI